MNNEIIETEEEKKLFNSLDEIEKTLKHNYYFKAKTCISSYLDNIDSLNINSLDILKDRLINELSISEIDALKSIELWLAEYPNTKIMIDNYTSFLDYSEDYYKKLKKNNTVFNSDFYYKLTNWVDKTPPLSNIEKAKRLFVFEYLQNKTIEYI